MYRFAVAAVLMGLSVGGVILADEKAFKELEGTYRPLAIVKDGKEASEEFRDSVTVKFASDELTFTIKDKSYPAKIKVNPAKKPAHIDITPSDGPEKGRTFPGIYKVEKSELLLAFVEKGERPTEFKGEGNAVLFRLTREKKEKKPARPGR
jgi:uncharacterized protein (TIGR03067 family)